MTDSVQDIELSDLGTRTLSVCPHYVCDLIFNAFKSDVHQPDVEIEPSLNMLCDAGNVQMEVGNSRRFRGSLSIYSHILENLVYISWKPSSDEEGRPSAVFLALSEIDSFQCKGTSHLNILRNGSRVIPLFFAHGPDNRQIFLSFLLTNGLIEQSSKDPSTYLVIANTIRVVEEEESATLARLRAKHHQTPQHSNDVDQPKTTTPPPTPVAAPQRTLTPPRQDTPVTIRDTLFGSFAKVTAKTREIIQNMQLTSLSDRFDRNDFLPRASGLIQNDSLPGEYDNMEYQGGPSDPSHQIECRQMKKFGNLGEFEILDEFVAMKLEECHRQEPLSKEQWKTHVSKQGRIVNATELREIIFLGGVAPEIRRDVWKYLLFHRSASFSENNEFVSRRRDEYFVMKTQWTSISERQLERNHFWKEQVSRVAKDIPRTDRDQPYYADDDSPHLVQLNDILLTYCTYNHDLGYVQGMSDLAAVILEVMDDEVDAFWGFVGVMDQFGWATNFSEDQNGMNHRLNKVMLLLRFIDPELMNFLDAKFAAHLLFCFRWLLIQFKREFQFEQIKSVWEAIWSQHQTNSFDVFIACAILLQNREHIMKPDMDFDIILQFINSLSGKLDPNTAIEKAQSILKYLVGEYGTLPPEIRALVIMPEDEI